MYPRYRQLAAIYRDVPHKDRVSRTRELLYKLGSELEVEFKLNPTGTDNIIMLDPNGRKHKIIGQGSKLNERHVEVGMCIVDALLRLGLSPEHIAILTPYNV